MALLLAAPKLASKIWPVLLHMESARLLVLLVIIWGAADFVLLLTERVDVSTSVNALKVLRLDRQAFLAKVMVKVSLRAAIIWLYLGSVIALCYIVYGVISVLCRVLLGGGGTASGGFSDARFWLACTRRTPWRIMAFFNDAVSVGVLQQAGAGYRFRHVLLQQELSSRHSRLARGIIARTLNPRLVELLDWQADRALWASVTTAPGPPWPWRWWWLQWWWHGTSSTAPWTEPIWAVRFARTARDACELVGGPAEPVHREGPGVAQLFDSIGGDHSWVICALPHRQPTLVARPVWDALQRATGGPRGDALTSLGLPANERVVPADAERLELRKGAWGPGLLLRDHSRGGWRWQPETRLERVPWKEWPWTRPPLPQLRVRAEAKIPCPQSGLAITSRIRRDLAGALAASDLARTVTKVSSRGGYQLCADRWHSSREEGSARESRITCAVGAIDQIPALVAEVMLSLASVAGSTILTTAAELRIEDIGTWIEALHQSAGSRPGATELMLSLDDLVDILAACWGAAAELMPPMIIGDIGAMPPVGPPKVDLLVSAATPLDLLLMRGILNNVRRADREPMLALLLSGGHGKRLKRGDLRDFIDFSPFRPIGRISRFNEMFVRIAGPLRFSDDERQQLTREALALMIPWNYVTSDVEWSDTTKAAVHSAYRV